jgi:AraC-like DNA-binding protein
VNDAEKLKLHPPATARETTAGYTYVEFPSDAPHILCTWTLRTDPGQPTFSQRVIPDGCVDVVWFNRDELHVAGPATLPVDVSIPAGATVVGVRFHPGAGCDALGMPPRELLNQSLSLAGVLPNLTDKILSAQAGVEGASERRGLLERAMAGYAEEQTADDQVLAAVKLIAEGEDSRIENVAEHVGLCARQLRRRFHDAVGYGPKTFHRVVRLQRLLSLLRMRGNAIDLCAAALEAGYADQAHMTRECGELAGQSPVDLIAGTAHPTLEMSDLFKTPQCVLR